MWIKSGPSRLGKKPDDWRWSSARAHIKRKDDTLVKIRPLLEMVKSPWKKILTIDTQNWEREFFRKHERTGRPIGDDEFIVKLEGLLDRELKPKTPGRRAKDK